MRRYSPGYYSPPRRGYGGRGRNPPRRGYGSYGGRQEPNNGSLLVRNIPLSCRPEDIRVPFERFGPVRDVYIPRDYYTGEPRGFAFVQFVDSYDASEAKYHMDRQIFGGREITVLVASETRKRPEEMRRRARLRGDASYDGGRSSYYGRSCSQSISRSRSHSRSHSHSRSPHYASISRMRHRSRSYSPAPRRQDDYSTSPRRRRSDHSRSPGEYEQEEDQKLNNRSYSPNKGRKHAGNHKTPNDSPRRSQLLHSKSPREYFHEEHDDVRKQGSYSPEITDAGRSEAINRFDQKKARRPSYSSSGSQSRSADSSERK